MRQLIEKFQRTNTTPRTAVLPTPAGVSCARFDTDLMSIDPTGSLGLDTPRSFGNIGLSTDANDWDDPLQLGETSAHLMWNASEPTPRGGPMGGKMSTRMSRPRAVNGQLMQLHQQGSGNSINAFSESGEDNSPVDMAVLAAFHVATRSSNAEQIMQMLICDSGPPTVSARSAAFQGNTAMASVSLTIVVD